MTLASPEIIYVSVVIDTDYVKDHYSPNSDKNNPKGIAHNSQYMIVDYQHVYANQATADLHIKANPGDTVRFYGTCIQANSSDAVLLYGMPKFGGDNVFGPFRYSPFTLDNAVMPDSNQPDGLPPLTTKLTFPVFTADVLGSGTENFKVWFALYQQNGSSQELYGYYQWDPTITSGGAGLRLAVR
ncbi:MAG: DNA-directed RNA polymerase subunit beta [Symploca sp. SIO2E9]|nr:DNA-directed RNA polymerase subunit beta [Symploca sp. SIO2E9]